MINLLIGLNHVSLLDTLLLQRGTGCWILQLKKLSSLEMSALRNSFFLSTVIRRTPTCSLYHAMPSVDQTPFVDWKLPFVETSGQSAETQTFTTSQNTESANSDAE